MHEGEAVSVSSETERKPIDQLPTKVVSRVAGLTRFIVIVPVLGLLVSAVALVVTGAIQTVRIILASVVPVSAGGATLKETLVSFIELADLFLLAVVIYIIALGLFELFIESDLRLPEWLQFHDLDDLKYRLLGVIVVVLAVTFLGRAIQVKEAQDLFWIGAGVSSVIAALALFMKSGHTK